MTREQLENKLKDYLLNTMDSDDVVKDYREFCEHTNYEAIYFMYEFDELVPQYNEASKQEEIERIVRDFKDFDFNAGYFYFDGYGYMTATNDPFDVVDIDQLIDAYIDGTIVSEDSYINELVDEYNDTETEE